ALAEADALVRALLERLDPPSRAVFVLAELQGRSVPEIASSLGLNPRTTYSRLRVARERFTRELRRWQHQEDIRVRGREPRRLAATRASRERDEPITPRKRDAIWAALVVRIDEVPTLPAPAPAAIASLSPAAWVAAGVGLVCGSALVVGLIRPPEVADKNVQRDRSPAAAVAPEAVAPAVARLELDPGPQRSEVDAPTSTPDAAPRRRRRPTPAPASSPAPTSALSAELALLRRASAAEASGALAVARASLEEHARRFPDGHLAPERERALIRLLCAQGEVAAARARARSFATASHRPLASVLPQGCGPAS
ncbi:MAG: sigma-70 family RNA polymerase sigma factor, partial [Myxococcales bacterium]|nr:sigma-70 family RNA polymerase sigma factor [Myxococcales bacterium]